MTPAARLAGRTAAETISVVLAVFARIDPALRKSITVDNDAALAPHALAASYARHDHSVLRYCPRGGGHSTFFHFPEIIRICSHIHVEPGEVGRTAFLWF
jgi:hypothetical protein